MTTQKVCDGCGAVAKADESGQWARLHVPSNPSAWLFGRKPAVDEPDHPEFDLCQVCFGQVQSLLSLFTDDQRRGGAA